MLLQAFTARREADQVNIQVGTDSIIFTLFFQCQVAQLVDFLDALPPIEVKWLNSEASIGKDFVTDFMLK